MYSTERAAMLVPGHEHLLKRSLVLLLPKERLTGSHKREAASAAFARLLGLPETKGRACYKALLHGVVYPDVPCAHRLLDESTGEVRTVDTKHCSWARMETLLRRGARSGGLRGEVYSEAFVSHKLSLSHWHAMSANPQDSVRVVLDRIVRFAQGAALRAMASEELENQLFWLGRLLHLVQDAYSPAHVLRVPRRADPKALARTLRALTALSEARVVSPRASDLSSELVVRALHRAAARCARAPGLTKAARAARGIAEELRASGIDPSSVKVDRPDKPAWRLFLAFLDEERAAEQAGRLAVGGRAQRDVPTRPPAVITVHCYAAQDPVKHLLHDRISEVEAQGLHEHAVRDGSQLLSMFADAHAGRDARKFVRGVRGLLRQRVFRLHAPACARLLTGFDISRVTSELELQ